MFVLHYQEIQKFLDYDELAVLILFEYIFRVFDIHIYIINLIKP